MKNKKKEAENRNQGNAAIVIIISILSLLVVGGLIAGIYTYSHRNGVLNTPPPSNVTESSSNVPFNNAPVSNNLQPPVTTPQVVSTIGPPPVMISQPQDVVLIPGTDIYFAPGMQLDIFFYNGYWWCHRESGWYRYYSGKWGLESGPYVPSIFSRIPENYRSVYAHESRIPYKQWQNKMQSQLTKRSMTNRFQVQTTAPQGQQRQYQPQNKMQSQLTKGPTTNRFQVQTTAPQRQQRQYQPQNKMQSQLTKGPTTNRFQVQTTTSQRQQRQYQPQKQQNQKQKKQKQQNQE